MASVNYSPYEGEFGNGGTNFGYAGSFISKISTTATYGKDSNNWVNPRRFVGSDWSGYNYTYTYCAFADIPAGNNFSITLTITVNNDGWYSGGNSAKTMRAGYSLQKPVEGTDRAAGLTNELPGVTGKDFTIAASNSSHSNTSGTVTFNLPNEYAGRRVYFSFWAKNCSTVYSCFRFRKLAATLTYTDYSSPTKPSISDISPSIMAKNGSVTVTINPGADGTNNPISKYKFYYGTSSGDTSKSFTKDKPDSSNEIVIKYSDIGSPAAGSKIYLGVQAIGSVSGYNSSVSSSNSDYVTINSAPGKPTIALSKSVLPNSGALEDVKINSLQATDPDGDDLTFWCVASSSTTAPSSGWFEVEEGDTISCSSNKPYIFFKAHDGYQYGPTSYKTLIANAGPKGVAVGSATGDGYYGYDGEYYTRQISVAAVGDSAYTYEWEYRYGSGGWNQLGIGQTLNNKTLTAGLGIIYVRVTATDALGDVSQTDPYETGLRYARSLTDEDISVEIFQLHNKQNTTKTEAYSRKMSASFDYAPQTNHDPTISSVHVVLSQNGTEYDKITLGGNFNQKDISIQQSKNFEFAQEATKLLSYATLTCNFYGENAVGDQLPLYTKSFDISLLPLLDFVFAPDLLDTQKQIDLDLVNLTDGEERFIVRYLDEACIEKYEILALIDGAVGEKNLTNYATFSKDSTDNALITFPTNQLEPMFQSMRLPSDKDYKGTVTIHAVNVLGEVYRNTETENGNKGFITIKTTAAPIFKAKSGNNAPFIEQYISQTKTISGTPTPDWTQPLPENTTRMLNPEEYFYLNTSYEIEQPMKKWFDGSGNAPVDRASKTSYTYTIVYTVVEDGQAPTRDSSWQVVGDLADISALDTFQFPSSLQPLEGPERIFFGLKVKDELGFYAVNESNDNVEQLYEGDPNRYLLWCRRTTPTIRIADCRYDESGYYMVTLETEDFGGNAKGYANFNRFKSSDGIEEGCEGAMKITWSCGATLDSMREITDNHRKGRISALERNADRENPSFDFGTLGGLKGKIYLQATITFYTNTVGAELVGRTQIFVLQTDTPTVAYRNHLVGINAQPDTIDFESDVLVISNFQNKRFVRLMAVDDNGEPRQILINLKDGTVSGLVIDGGTW